MQGSEFDESAFFRAIGAPELRCLLIGRQALIALGLPVLTADYDVWIHIDDIEALNRACEPFGLFPNHPPATARQRGRYVLENDERVDVLVARSLTTVDGVRLAFEELWLRRETLTIASDVTLCVPSLDDLIATKRLASRPQDAQDIRLLTELRSRRRS
jgi:hypothetical protein